MPAPRLTWLDRAIAVVSPEAAAKRVRARLALDQVRAYDGASSGRRSAGWRAAGTSADAETAAAGGALRDRMREQVRNNPHAAKALAALTNNIVGNGIEGRIKTGDEALDARLNALWKRWSEKCDADGQLDFNGLQTLVVRGMIEGGEMLVRREWRRVTDRIPGNMVIRVLEGDHIDSSKDGPLTTGNTLIQGVEFDKIGRRVAYHLFPHHPGARTTVGRYSISSVRVPADGVIHVYEKQRTQVRGVPWGTPALTSMRDLRDFEDAELLRKKIEACMVGIVTGGDENEMFIGAEDRGAPGVYDSAGLPVERFEPGMFLHARGGRDVKFNSPIAVPGYDTYKRSMLHTIAAGWRIPYELLTGDLSQVNYSSIRAGLTEFRRLVEAVQYQLVIAMFLRRVGDWFVEAHVFSGDIRPEDAERMTWEWTPPKWYSVDPLKDVMADILELRAGLATLPQKIAERGYDADALLEEVAATNETLDRLKLILDSDPRATAKNGSLQINLNIGADGGDSNGSATNGA